MSRILKVTIIIFIVMLLGFLIPEPRVIPVKNATANDWNQQTFWHYPWGSSIVHKGIDIFGMKGTPVNASTHLIILYAGEIQKGGKVVLGLGPKWRLHYFAHMESRSVKAGSIVFVGENIGTLGDSGNAANKPPHLHFSILTLLPYFWRIDDSIQGHKKAIYLDPGAYLQ